MKWKTNNMAMASFGHLVHHQDAREKKITKTNTYNRNIYDSPVY